MIPKMNSKELNNILAESQASITAIEENVSTIKDDLINKLSVIKNEQEYSMQELLNIKETLNGSTSKDLKNRIVYARQTGLDGLYDAYGCSVHPRLVRDPGNVFNFMTTAGPLFKNNATVRINDAISESQKAMLMHDAIPGKGIAFAEYDSAQIKIEIEANIGDLLGDTLFNMIELSPFLPGSFTIDSLEVYNIESFLSQSILADYNIAAPINMVGASRIILDKKLSFYKLVMNITVNHQNKNGKYPFGLRHIYFYNADFNPNSYVIAKIEKNRFIDWISEEIRIRDQYGLSTSTCSASGVTIYMGYENDILQYEIATSLGLTENAIARNTKELYVKLPLKHSVVSLEFDKIADR